MLAVVAAEAEWAVAGGGAGPLHALAAVLAGVVARTVILGNLRPRGGITSPGLPNRGDITSPGLPQPQVSGGSVR